MPNSTIFSDWQAGAIGDREALRGRQRSTARGGDGQVVLAEFGELILPLVPERGKAVEEEDERAFARADVVEFHAVDGGVFVFEFGSGGERHDKHHDNTQQSHGRQYITDR